MAQPLIEIPDDLLSSAMESYKEKRVTMTKLGELDMTVDTPVAGMAEDLTVFTPEEFADYLESVVADNAFGIDFMTKKIETDEGVKFLEDTVTVIANRKGVSSNEVKSFRTSLHKACVKANVPKLTPKKLKGSKKGQPVSMYICEALERTSIVTMTGEDMLIATIQNGISKGKWTLSDLEAVHSRIVGE